MKVDFRVRVSSVRVSRVRVLRVRVLRVMVLRVRGLRVRVSRVRVRARVRSRVLLSHVAGAWLHPGACIVRLWLNPGASDYGSTPGWLDQYYDAKIRFDVFAHQRKSRLLCNSVTDAIGWGWG